MSGRFLGGAQSNEWWNVLERFSVNKNLPVLAEDQSSVPWAYIQGSQLLGAPDFWSTQIPAQKLTYNTVKSTNPDTPACVFSDTSG